MNAEVRFTIVRGLSEGKEFRFPQRAIGAIGRGDDCLLRLPGSPVNMDVSRHHCLLDIAPPAIWVHDMGSRNGTYVNGEKIGQRTPGVAAEAATGFDLPERSLRDGDELRVGSITFRVNISGEDKTAGTAKPTNQFGGVPVR
jgi:pSer/pThr/pTyr-binding forkhead associated (FHA) protein